MQRETTISGRPHRPSTNLARRKCSAFSLQCEAREDYYRTQRDVQYVMERQSAQLEEKDAQIESLSAENQNLVAENSRLLAWAAEHGYKVNVSISDI